MIFLLVIAVAMAAFGVPPGFIFMLFVALFVLGAADAWVKGLNV